MPAVYPTRMWRKVTTDVYIEDEKRLVSLDDMTDEEFRAFLLWRLGLSAGNFDMPAPKDVMQSQASKLRPRMIDIGEYGDTDYDVSIDPIAGITIHSD